MNHFSEMGISITWVTNLPAPYRKRIWETLGKTFDLKLFFLLKENNYRKWTYESTSNFSVEFFSKPSFRYKELEFILGIKHAKRVVELADIIIVGGWDNFFYIETIRQARRFHTPVILFYESTLASHQFNGILIRKLRTWIFSLADHVVTVGDASTRAVLDIGVEPSKVLTLFNPVDVTWFDKLASENRSQDLLGHQFLYVGSLIERKNVRVLIEAFSEIRNPSDCLTIVGDGPLASELKGYVKSIQLEDFIEFTGHKNQEQLALEYAKANTLVLPSTNEVWGLVVNEALASGLHVVVSSSAGVAEFVRPMDGVYIADPVTTEMSKALSESRDWWNGPISKPEILNYTPERFAHAIEELVRELNGLKRNHCN